MRVMDVVSEFTVVVFDVHILNNMFRPGKAPIVDVVAVVVVLISVLPIYFAQRLTAAEKSS